MPEYADFLYTAGEKCGLADMGEREVENGRSADQRCLRILHVNFGIERGGIETWLARLIRRFDHDRYTFALAYHRGRSASMKAEYCELGVELHQLPRPRSPMAFIAAFRRLLCDAGPFDVVHSHLNFPGMLMLAASMEGVPVRIAQSHVSPELMTPGLLAGGFVRTTNRLFRKYMTTGIGVSGNAARTLFGRHWQQDHRVRIEPCGIDLSPFSSARDEALRGELGIPDDAFLIGVIGRFAPEKNHAFALQVAALLAEREPALRLLLVGDGPERNALSYLAECLGIEKRVLFVGERDDVPALLTGVIDVMLLPSLTEGSPLTVIEAQAAGVPSVVSLAVPAASVVVAGAVQRLALADGKRAWAEAVVTARSRGRIAHGLDCVRDSRFDLRHNVRFFDACYRRLDSCEGDTIVMDGIDAKR